MASDSEYDYDSDESSNQSDNSEHNIFAGLSEDQIKLIRDKVSTLQKQYNNFLGNQEEQKVHDFLQSCPMATQKEAEIAIEACHNNELMAIQRYQCEGDFRTNVQSMAKGEIEIDYEVLKKQDLISEIQEAFAEVDAESEDSDYEDEEVYADWRTGKSKKSKHSTIETHSDEKKKKTQISSKEKHQRVKRLLLNDALEQLKVLYQQRTEGDLSTKSGNTPNEVENNSEKENEDLEVMNDDPVKSQSSDEPMDDSEVLSVSTNDTKPSTPIQSEEVKIEPKDEPVSLPSQSSVLPKQESIKTKQESKQESTKSKKQTTLLPFVLKTIQSSTPSTPSNDNPPASPLSDKQKEDDIADDEEEDAELDLSASQPTEDTQAKSSPTSDVQSHSMSSSSPLDYADLSSTNEESANSVPKKSITKESLRKVKQVRYTEIEDDDDDDYESGIKKTKRRSRTGYPHKRQLAAHPLYIHPRETPLTVNNPSPDSLDTVPYVSEKDLEALGWSSARIKAYYNRKSNPNAYYYRFNDPGVPQATGAWSAEEKKKFMNLIKEGVDYQWGIFSTYIPGRVGYQCSNFYRLLVNDGEIIDDNYVYDEKKGKYKFQFRDKDGKCTLHRSRKLQSEATSPTCYNSTGDNDSANDSINGSQNGKNEDTAVSSSAPSSPTKRVKRRKTATKRRRRMSFSDYENDHVTIQPEVEENILPGFIDPVTMEEVIKPAISPYGHVMGYDSWNKILNQNPKNTCPFTKQKLTRRMLIKLTKENIDEYKDKILNRDHTSCPIQMN